MSTPSAPEVLGGTLRATRKPFLAVMTEEEKAADRERRANRPPREEGDRDRGRSRC